jgi:large subunit ribosomal protein L18
MAKQTPEQLRKRRHMRIRNVVIGTTERPRLTVHRSNKGLFAQVVDDANGKTLAHASWLEADIKAAKRTERAEKVGEAIGSRAKAAGVSSVVFDRGGYLYHGRVKQLADAARKAGLEF